MINAPRSSNVGMYDTSVRRIQGKTFVTTELGGGGSLDGALKRHRQKGVRNVLQARRHHEG